MTVNNRFQARNVNRTTPDTDKTDTNTVVKGNNKTVKRRDSSSDGRRRAFKNTTKTHNFVEDVFELAQLEFKKKQLNGEIHPKMSFGMYLSDLMYFDLHKKHLFDYKTSEIIDEYKI